MQTVVLVRVALKVDYLALVVGVVAGVVVGADDADFW